MYRYYISFSYKPKNNEKYLVLPVAVCTICRNGPIASMDDVKMLAEEIRADNDYENVSILSFSRFNSTSSVTT